MWEFEENLRHILNGMLWGDTSLQWHALHAGQGKREPYLLFSQNMQAKLRYEASVVDRNRLLFLVRRDGTERQLAALEVNLAVEPSLAPSLLNSQPRISVCPPPMLDSGRTGSEWLRLRTESGGIYKIGKGDERFEITTPDGQSFELNADQRESDAAFSPGKRQLGMAFITELMDGIGSWRQGDWLGTQVDVSDDWDGGIGPALKSLRDGYAMLADYFDGDLPDPGLQKSRDRLARKHPLFAGGYSLRRTRGKLILHLDRGGQILLNRQETQYLRVEIDFKFRLGEKMSGMELDINFPEFLVKGDERDKVVTKVLNKRFKKLWKSVRNYRIQESFFDFDDGIDDSRFLPQELSKEHFREFVNDPGVRAHAHLIRIQGHDTDMLDLQGQMMGIDTRMLLMVHYSSTEQGIPRQADMVDKTRMIAVRWDGEWPPLTGVRSDDPLIGYVTRLLAVLAAWQVTER